MAHGALLGAPRRARPSRDDAAERHAFLRRLRMSLAASPESPVDLCRETSAARGRAALRAPSRRLGRQRCRRHQAVCRCGWSGKRQKRRHVTWTRGMVDWKRWRKEDVP